MNNKVIVIAAPSGSGKSTIARHLLERFPELSFSVSATSRLPRGQERHGVEYYFFSVAEFTDKISGGEFFEWEEVYTGRFYGTLHSEMQRIFAVDKVILFDVDVVGGLNIKDKLGEKALAIFISPPSLEVLAERLRDRQTDSDEDIAMRLARAEKEMSYAAGYDYVIVNDDLHLACQEAERVVRDFLLD